MADADRPSAAGRRRRTPSAHGRPGPRGSQSVAAPDARSRAQNAVDDLVKGAEQSPAGARTRQRRRSTSAGPPPTTTSRRSAPSCARSAAGSTRSRSACPSRGRRARARQEAQGLSVPVAGRRVLITGVASHLGTELARRLETDPEVEYIAGLDYAAAARRARAHRVHRGRHPQPDDRQADPADRGRHRRPQPDHPPAGRRHVASRAMHDINVIGTLQLLAACEKTPSIRAIVIRGSAGIYGSEPAAPQFFTEEMARLYPLRTRFQRDVGEIENYFETFARRHPQVVCTMLRYQPTIGPSVDTPDHALPGAAGRADLPRLRPAAAVRPRARCDRGARRRGQEPGPRRGQRGRRRGRSA